MALMTNSTAYPGYNAEYDPYRQVYRLPDGRCTNSRDEYNYYMDREYSRRAIEKEKAHMYEIARQLELSHLNNAALEMTKAQAEAKSNPLAFLKNADKKLLLTGEPS